MAGPQTPVLPVAEIAVAAELEMFLRHGQRLTVVCDGVSTLGHVVESVGVPLTEVGRLLVNGQPADARYRPRGGDLVDVRAVSRPQRPSPRRFVLDVHLGTVARWLRLVGVDAAYSTDADDDELIEQANADQRLLLTQDRGILRRRSLRLGAFVRGARPDAQFADVLDRFAPPLAPWTRCTSCNGLLDAVPKAEVASRLQPGTRRSYQAFAQCRDCGHVYWRGAHSGRLDAIVESALARQPEIRSI